MPGELIYRFGRFELDLHRRELRAGGDRVPLQPRVFELLRYFAANPSRAIARDELLAEVWAGISVTDASLTKAVRALRAGLGSDPLLRGALQTVRGHGYRFRAPVEILDPRGRQAKPPEERERLFVGRETELARIAEHTHRARQGGRRFVLVVGDPGTGKTALAYHALDAAAGFLAGEGQCIEGFGEQSPYLPILEAIVNFARSDADSNRTRVRQIVERAAPDWRAHLPSLFPDEELDPRRIDLHRAKMAPQILDAIEMIGSERPAALILEDIHWADHSTLALLHSIARRSAPSRLLTICTVRKSELEGSEALRALRVDLSRSAAGLVLETTPLSIDSIRDYVVRNLRRDGVEPGVSTDRFVDWLHARTGGHPLFMTQLVEHLSSLDLLTASQGESFSARRLDEAGIPATLAQLIRHWVTRLDPIDRAFLEAASAAGFQFDLRVTRAALGVGEQEAEASCDRLCQAGWLQFRDFASWGDGSRAARLRFEHVLFREALYEDIAPGRRARLHQAIARRIEAGHPGQSTISNELAAHYELAGDFAEAARHRIAAAAFAASTQSADEALHHAERGLRSLEVLPIAGRATAEIDLRMALGMAYAARSGFGDDRAMEAFERARQLARENGDVPREVAGIWGIASCRKMRGELESTREDGARLLALAESTDEPRYLLLALDLLCSVAYFQGRFADCLALKQRADAAFPGELGDALLARSLEDVRVTTQLYAALAHWHRGDDATALDWIRDAVARAERLAHPYTSAFAEGFAAIARYLVGDANGQRWHAARGRSVCERSGIAPWGEIARFMELCSDPPSAESLPALRATLAKMAQYGGLGGTFFIDLLANRELAAGNVEAAAKLCRVGLDRAVRTGETHHLPMLYVTAARLAREDSERAMLLAKAETSATRIGSVGFQRQIARARAAGVMGAAPG